jgi:hypothetical protein
MQDTEIKYLGDGKKYYPVEGCWVTGSGKIAGIYRWIEDMTDPEAEPSDILAWDKLTPDEQVIATANSDDMTTLINQAK